MDARRLKLQIFNNEKLVFTDVTNLEPKINRELVMSSFGDKENFCTIYLIGSKIGEGFVKPLDLEYFDDLIRFSSLPREHAS